MVKLIRRAFNWIIIRRKYKPEDLFIIFRPEDATSLQLNRKLWPCYIIATSLVQSRLDYCNSLYYSLPASQLHRLQLIQNALARAVSWTPLHSPTFPVLYLLHWLKIEQGIQYKIISITLKLLHSATPSYLYRLLNIQPTRLTRFSNCLCLAHPKLTSRLKFSDRSFRNAAPSLWNKLPTTLHFLSTEATHANPVPFPPLALSRQQYLKQLKTKAVDTRIFHYPVPELHYPNFTRYPNFLFLLKTFHNKNQCIVII